MIYTYLGLVLFVLFLIAPFIALIFLFLLYKAMFDIDK